MMADIYTDFLHHLDTERMNLCGWFSSCRTDIPIGMKVLEYALCHLATASVAGANNEDVHIVKVKSPLQLPQGGERKEVYGL